LAHHRADLALVRAAVADDRALRDRGRILNDDGAERARAREHDAAAFADAQRRLRVARGERLLDDDDVRTDELEDLRDLLLDPAEALGHGRRALRAQHTGGEQTWPRLSGDDGTVADDERSRIDAEHDRPSFRIRGVPRDCLCHSFGPYALP